MKKIAARVLSLKTRLFGRMSRIKSVRHLALSIRLGVYGDVLTSSLVPIPVRRRRIWRSNNITGCR